MSKRGKKRAYQRASMKMNQSAEGLLWVSVLRHNGRTTNKVEGPMSDDHRMSVDLFKSERRFL